MVGNNRLNCFLCDYDLCTECCIVAEKQVTAAQMFVECGHKAHIYLIQEKNRGIQKTF